MWWPAYEDSHLFIVQPENEAGNRKGGPLLDSNQRASSLNEHDSGDTARDPVKTPQPLFIPFFLSVLLQSKESDTTHILTLLLRSLKHHDVGGNIPARIRWYC